MIGIGTLLVLALIGGSIMGWISFLQIRKLREDISTLQNRISKLSVPPGIKSADSSSNGASIRTSEPVRPKSAPETEKKAEWTPGSGQSAIKTRPAVTRPAWLDHLIENWMVWLGGICVALAGIFLVRFAMEQGFLGPTARIVSGILLGIVLHGAAEYLRRNVALHPSFAALAAAGSITLFASVLSALHLYGMLVPGAAFFLLAIIGVATMFLALWHGPIMAVLGIVGAYLVPLLIGSETDGSMIVLIYSLIISGSVLLLLRYIFKPWLWYIMLAGSLGWWLLTIASPQVENFQGIYLALLAYFMLAVPANDWLLKLQSNIEASAYTLKDRIRRTDPYENLLLVSLLLVIACQGISIIVQGFSSSAVVNWSPLVVLVIYVAGKREYLDAMPWLILVVQLLAWLGAQLDVLRGEYILEPISDTAYNDFFLYALVSAFLYFALAFRNFLINRFISIWISLAVLAPLAFLTLTYLLVADSAISLQWSLLALLLGAIYIAFASFHLQKTGTGPVPAWLFLSGHLAYSLAAAMFFREASLTLALAVQIISLVWVIRKFEMTSLEWLVKGVLFLVVCRLTLNPWLARYPVDIHWSLWTYGGSMLCCLGGALQLEKTEKLARWLRLGALHLFILTIWAELRYWLYDGGIYTPEYEFLEAAINANLFAALAILAHWRSLSSAYLEKLYRIYNRALLAFAGVNYLIIVFATLFSLGWVWDSISETRIFNSLLLAYGLPVVMGMMVYKFYARAFRKPAVIFSGLAFLLFVSLEIKHLWEGSIRIDQEIMSAELYTYSIVWLLIAVTAILAGIWKFGNEFYRAGMLLLLVVIAKLFLVDMSDLQGLLRVASFMGMGLALLGIAFLHQRVKQKTA